MLKKEFEWNGRMFKVEAGDLARQASGSVRVQYGDTVVLVTAVASKGPREGVDFFPLMVDYQEMTYAAGKIPGGFFKREGRPSEKEILTSRLIDRPLRPLFPKGYINEVQIVATVLSADEENDPDILGMIGASAALEISDIPFCGPIAGVRVGRIDGKLVCNPINTELKKSELDLIIAGNREGIVMVEGGANFITEDIMLEAMIFGHQSLQKVLDIQEEMKREIGKPKVIVPPPSVDAELKEKITSFAADRMRKTLQLRNKAERHRGMDDLYLEAVEKFAGENGEKKNEVTAIFSDLERDIVRNMILREKRRIDGRGLKDIRPIDCGVAVLPRTHGSALFTRGETQVLAVTTLGTSSDEQKIDSLIGETYKTFMLHYNFPPFSVGEVKPLRGPSRREVGHGALAERSIARILPNNDNFPYTIRIVSEVLESNGSSSMATVCGSSLSLMDAGVPVKTAVAGIAMGLIKEGDQVAVLTDILGDEDHIGDMDFKVAGTRDGITGFQMDIKISGLAHEIMREALTQAREGRIFILDKMAEAIQKPRPDLSIRAPRIVTIMVKQDKIRDVIGPGGKTIRGIIEQTGVKIEIDDSGKANIASNDLESLEKAIKMVKDLIQEVEVDKIYLGKVKKIVDFGAFVEILPGTDGLVHISQLAPGHVKNVRDVLSEGDEVVVKVLEIDRQGKIKLSRKEALGCTPDA
ncbi:MAG TPA: polyribonucleotide nucleotidyltransferase [Thermodesulfobacteriota bacterium]|nr:polyribonucleotide nucleotidyltransferase [Thermodesulfobacteriota bacterium]